MVLSKSFTVLTKPSTTFVTIPTLRLSLLLVLTQLVSTSTVVPLLSANVAKLTWVPRTTVSSCPMPRKKMPLTASSVPASVQPVSAAWLSQLSSSSVTPKNGFPILLKEQRSSQLDQATRTTISAPLTLDLICIKLKALSLMVRRTVNFCLTAAVSRFQDTPTVTGLDPP